MAPRLNTTSADEMIEIVKGVFRDYPMKENSAKSRELYRVICANRLPQDLGAYVECDEITNTPEMIDRDELALTYYFRRTRTGTPEFIQFLADTRGNVEHSHCIADPASVF